MKRFNKYAFLGDLQDQIEQSDSGDVYSVIHQEIDKNEVEKSIMKKSN